MDHSKPDPVEINGKHSLHNSGIMLGPRKPGNRRIERHTIPLTNYQECIPLVGVLLMNPLTYPRSSKQIRENDIILPTSRLEKYPLAFLLYLQPDEVKDTKILDDYRNNELCVEGWSRRGIFTIRAALYTNPEKFSIWPQSQVEAVARGLGDKPSLLFPIFLSSPQR